ncbi:hypothetical protein RRF57_007421 [Xylaria bambusicola]|uniref:Nudix hydrolase domain-containing protein n=1 Tax=Xylaria bambusicola TaxID=326684 RepID=A0AAN7UMQ9_9PEZI
MHTRYATHPENWRHGKQAFARAWVHCYVKPACLKQIRRESRLNATIISGKGRTVSCATSTMRKGARASSSGPSAKAKAAPEPCPSSSIILLSPINQVLLLHRVKNSTSFASAHVFPGGNLSDFHDGPVPPPGDARRHEDSLAYRLGAIRETFEESGILLARERSRDGPLLNLPTSERDAARKAIHDNEISFREWVASIGGVADTEGLLPFTRWITPHGPPKRFTTQMYVYMLPLETSPDPVLSAAQSEALIPTADGGAEITAAHFDDVATWLERQNRGDLILFPPQYFLLHLLSQFLKGAPTELRPSETTGYYRAQRDKLRVFLNTVPTTTHPKAMEHPTSRIPWADKAISPVTLGLRHGDRRAILGLDKPGGELKGSSRGGDWERVVLVKFDKGVASNVEVRGREEVLTEEREARAKEEALSKL